MMNKLKTLLLVYFLLMFFGASCARQTPSPMPTAVPTVTSPGPDWTINPARANIAILVLDYQSLELKAAYFTQQEHCRDERSTVTEAEMRRTASGIFNAAGEYWPRRSETNARGEQWEELDFEIKYVGDLAVLEVPPGDFGAFAVMHRCSGLALYAGSIIWAGKGEQLYPAEPVDPASLTRRNIAIPPPGEVEVMIGPYAEPLAEGSGTRAWESVQDLNLVQDLATPPYDVLIYLYPKMVGLFNPAEAVWVIFVQRKPTE